MIICFYFAIVLFLLLCVLICAVVLVQESKSLGLGASFGGDPGESFFGTSTAAVLKTVTAYLAVAFILFCVGLSLWTAALSRDPSSAPLPTIEEIELP